MFFRQYEGYINKDSFEFDFVHPPRGYRDVIMLIFRFPIGTFCLMFWFLMIAGVSGVCSAVEINYEGLNERMVETLGGEPTLQKLAEKEDLAPVELRRDAALAKKDVVKVLEYYGYYNAHLNIRIAADKVTFNVVLGGPVRVGRIILKAEKPENLRQLEELFDWKRGRIFTHPEYEAAKVSILKTFIKAGYLKAHFSKSRVDILPGRTETSIILVLRAGIRYRFGQLRIEGMESYPDQYYQQWKTFQSGGYFSQEKLLKFYRNIQNSGLFESVTISANPKDAVGDEVPVTIDAKVYPPFSVTAGAGYATDFGPRVRLNVKRYNIFGTGHQFSTEILVDTKQQLLQNNYVIPVTERPDRAYTGYTTFQNRELPDNQQRLINLGFGYAARLDDKGEYSAGAAYNIERFDDALRQTLQARYFNVHTRRLWLALDDLIDPVRGFTLDLSGEGVAQPLLSDFSALKLEARAATYDAFWDKFLRVMGRLHVGYILACKSPANLPNSFRFFAGGDRSVRGYKFEGLAPRNSITGDIIGGKALLTTGVEAEIRITKQFGWMVYSDFGGATDTFSVSDFGFSVGTGVRWHSPVGPMAASVAFPLINSDDSFRFVVTVGLF